MFTNGIALSDVLNRRRLVAAEARKRYAPASATGLLGCEVQAVPLQSRNAR
jgi:hypothetical protein